MISGVNYPIQGIFSVTIHNEAPYFSETMLPLQDLEFPFNTFEIATLPTPIDSLSSCQTITMQVSPSPIV